jgi:hypothetical protein
VGLVLEGGCVPEKPNCQFLGLIVMSH